MANRETYPASLSPLTGDVSAPAGAQTATVVGIQTVPVDASAPIQQARLTYDDTIGKWTPKVPGNMSVLLDTIDISDDFILTVNNVGLELLVGWPYGFTYKVLVDGVGVV